MRDDDTLDRAVQKLVQRVEIAFRPSPQVDASGQQEAAQRPRLRIVTAENSHEFLPPPKKRGRPRKAKHNVVPLAERKAPTSSGMSPELDAWTKDFFSRINALPIGARSNTDET